jgi:hypothetical protein
MSTAGLVALSLLLLAAAPVESASLGKPEATVYLTGRSWCGSGGCPTLILRREGSSFMVVTRILATRPPIRVFETTSHGWRNISVWVSG